MSLAQTWTRSRISPQTIVMCAIIIISFLLRMQPLTGTNLWEDEIIAVTHAELHLPQLILNSIRNDMHPPLYFVQLHAWILLWDSDWWIVLNSILWSAMAVLAVTFVARRIYGPPAAVMATVVASAMPMNIELAQNVRMYPMISCLVVLFFFAQYSIFVQPRAGGRVHLWALSLGLGLAILFSHAIAFFFVFFLGVYFLLELVIARRPWKRFLEWGACYACLGIASLPVAVSSMLRGTDAQVTASAGGLEGAIFALSSLMTGVRPGIPGIPDGVDVQFVAGLLLLLAAIGGGVAFQKSRRMILCLLVLPVLVAMLIGFAAKPMFKAPVFASFCLPFVSLAAGAVTGSFRAAHRQATVVAACLAGVTLLCISTAVLLPPKPRPQNFAAASAVIMGGYQPTDIIYVPDGPMFWGMNRYIFGHQWGSPLDFADPPNNRWQPIYHLLGPRLVARLGLMPKSNLLENARYRVLTGYSDVAPARAARRVWLITYFDRKPPSPLIYEGRNVVEEQRFGGLHLSLLNTSDTSSQR